MYKVELHDGTILKDVSLNGSCYATHEKISEDTFKNKLKVVKIYEDDKLKEIITDAKLATVQPHPDGYMLFAFSGKSISPQDYTIEDVKESKIAEFKNKRDNEEVAPIEYNGHIFDFDDKARERMRIAREALQDAGGTGSIEWTTATNQRVTITIADFAQINAFAALRSNTLHVKYNQLKAEVEKAQTVEEVEAIVW